MEIASEIGAKAVTANIPGASLGENHARTNHQNAAFSRRDLPVA
jgi:hypothetical protein